MSKSHEGIVARICGKIEKWWRCPQHLLKENRSVKSLDRERPDDSHRLVSPFRRKWRDRLIPMRALPLTIDRVGTSRPRVRPVVLRAACHCSLSRNKVLAVHVGSFIVCCLSSRSRPSTLHVKRFPWADIRQKWVHLRLQRRRRRPSVSM